MRLIVPPVLNRFSRIRDAFTKVLDRVCTGFWRVRAKSRCIRESSRLVHTAPDPPTPRECLPRDRAAQGDA
eukprot:2039935-Prymnesium_polylepis.1